MRHVLHLIKDPTNRTAFDVVTHQAADPEIQLSVVLMQDAVRLELPGEPSVKVFRLDNRPANGNAMSPYPHIGHAELLDLIFMADTVITW